MKKATEKFVDLLNGYLRRERYTKSQFANEIGYSADQLYKWLSRANQVPYDAVQQMSQKLYLDAREQIEFYKEAGYPLPAWSLPSQEKIRQDGEAWGSTSVIEHGNAGYYRHQAASMSRATYRVNDLTWGIDVPSHTVEEEKSYQDYLASIQDVCRRGVVYREVMTFTDPHYVERARLMLGQNLLTYNLRYFDILDLRAIPPLIHFSVIDRQQVSWGFYRWPYLPIEDEVKVTTTQEPFVRLFADYFEAIWIAARPLKDGDKVYWKEFEEIERRYG